MGWFKKQPEKPKQAEVLWSDSALFNPADFPRYNPDTLIGRRGFDIYRQMMLDEQLKVAVKFRRNAVTSRDWGFEFDQTLAEELSDDEKELRIRVMTHALRRLPGAFKRSLNYVMLATEQGFSITEKLWGTFELSGKPWWGLKGLRAKPFDTFYAITDEFGALIRLEQEVGGKRQTVDPSKVIWYVVNPEVDEYYGQSELREAYRDWYSKDVLTKLENIYLERMAGGLVWATNTSEQGGTLSSTDQTALRNVLSNIQTKTGIQMPRGWELNVNNPTNTTAFSDAIERHDRNMAKALLMPNLMGFTESGQTGSYSQSQTQLEGFLWMLDSDADDLAEVLNEQLFRQLGDFNWGDGVYPEFRFKPLSKSQMTATVTLWKELISAGAVTLSESDEGYIRELLGFPAREEEEEETPEEEAAEGETPEEEAAEGESEPEVMPEDESTEPVEPEEMSHDHDHTFFPESGSAAIVYKAFTRAQRRVDFSAVDRQASTNEWSAEQDMGETMGRLAAYLADQVRENPELLNDPAELKKVKAPADITSALKKQSKAVLSEAWDIGVMNGKKELEKAGIQRMSKAEFARFAAIGDVAARFFEAKSFQMAGNLTDEALAIFRNIILNGIKYSKTDKEIIDQIYQEFASAGMITEDQAREVLGGALGVAEPTYRLQTVIRTNSFEAINEARYSYFTDPDLGGFVTALEYSAILDSRTTTICGELDGKVYPLRSPEWEKYRPPNHYNCRSLLVAVTTRDEDIEVDTTPPTVDPQKGFS